jgi:CO dehydrogenase/acetyl-CoA synthase epsilon subunit
MIAHANSAFLVVGKWEISQELEVHAVEKMIDSFRILCAQAPEFLAMLVRIKCQICKKSLKILSHTAVRKILDGLIRVKIL